MFVAFKAKFKSMNTYMVSCKQLDEQLRRTCLKKYF